MARSDFNMVHINHKFTSGAPVKSANFPIEGNKAPVDDAYLILQVQGVASIHSIFINDEHIGGVALAAAPGNSQAWRMGMAHIRPGLLHSGTNSIRINRHPTTDDDFRVNWVVVNWREP